MPNQRDFSRRDFIKGLATTAALATIPYPTTLGTTPPQRAKIAVIATEVTHHSHGQHILSRFAEGYGWQGRFHTPPMEVVSLYMDQVPNRDLGRNWAVRHPVKIYPTIAEALTLGTSRLAVDGVVIIGEFGDYPENDKGQKLYPRYRFFKEVVKVFEDSGRSVPVFNDKHHSTKWEECLEMEEDARRLGFPFLAGSSLPLTWRIPEVEIPLGTPMEESVCVSLGGIDSLDMHGIELAQCMSERRQGGEVGVKSVHAVRYEKVWEMLAKRPTTTRLALAAISRSHLLTPPPGFTFPVPSMEYARKIVSRINTFAYFIEHLDGFKTTILLLNGLISDFTYAGKAKDSDRIYSFMSYLPMPGRNATIASFFSPQVHMIAQMILTGKAPYPSARTLLTSGIIISAVESLYRGQLPLLTPELKIAYDAPQDSNFWKA